MTICHFFLQGRCRFGERCWNEHPRGGGGGGGGRPPQQPPAAPSGCNRGGWSGSSQRYSNIIQPSNFSKTTTWGGSRDPGKTPFGSFDSGPSSSGNRNVGFSQNRFSAVSSNQVDGQKDDDKLIEGIIKDMEVWESSGQWMFSVYSPVKEKSNISGFTDISPEELRLEYSNYITSNNLQSYLNSIQQLVNLWKNKLLELKNINPATKGALLSKLKSGGSQAATPFGFQSQQTSTFSSSVVGFPGNSNSGNSVQNFSFKSTSGFGATPSNSSTVFGSQGIPTAPALTAASSSTSTLTTSAPTSFGFGESGAVSAASFSFKSPEAFSFGSAGFSGFPASSPLGTAGAPGNLAFGEGGSTPGGGAFGPSGSGAGASLFGLSSGGCGHSSGTSSSLPSSGGSNTEHLFTPKNELTAEELKQFVAKKFTLGKVPLKPPPEGLLSI
ncbi:nucleoporin NUP42 [Macrotis lagotis]|uniref:nucleoporin NUP42 n=1 Tax=Macrotis lagotis TaxID=92651 RepID=UPI003D68A39C